MTIAHKPAQLIGGLLVALVGFCFVFWPPGLLGESVLYAIGPLLLAAGSVVAAIQFSVRPRTGMEEAAAPAEIDAWLALAYVGVLFACLLSNASAFAGSWLDPDARAASIVVLQVAIAYVVISTVLRARRGKAVQEDERDRGIRHRAARWGRLALIACVVVLMVTLGMSPVHELAWATPGTMALLLLLALLLGWLLESAATIAYYWRDRR